MLVTIDKERIRPMIELAPSMTPDAIRMRFRTTQKDIDDLTGLALVEDTSLAHQARLAVHGFLESPEAIKEPIEERKLIRKVEMELPVETVNGLGALATDRCIKVDQVLHAAFDRYAEDRIRSPELRQTIQEMIDGPTPDN